MSTDERLARALAILKENLNQNQNGEQTNMTTTYAKLQNGSWGLRSTGAIAPGQQVQVSTRDGRVKTETVGRIVWQSNGVTVASTARGEAQEATARPLTQVAQAPVAAPVAPAAPVAAPVARVTPAGLDQIIADLETALAGLKALRAA